MKEIWEHPDMPKWADFVGTDSTGVTYAFQVEPEWVHGAEDNLRPTNHHYVEILSDRLKQLVGVGVLLQRPPTPPLTRGLTTEEQAIWDEAILATLPRAFDAYSTAAKPEVVIEYATKYADALIKARRSIKV